MRKKTIIAVVIKRVALLALLVLPHHAMAQDAATPYPKMAPIQQYLMPDRDAEIALARSAAPESISRDAGVQVLGRHGFETAVKGKNGFVCIVERGWTGASDSDFWNSKVRVPMCVNASAARTYLLRILKWTELVMAGRTKAEMTKTYAAAIARKELPAMESGAMCYMMSKEGYGGDSTEHWPSHLMFFYSKLDPAAWGANLPGSPVFGVEDPLEQLTSFAIATPQWSDGTAVFPASPPHVHP